MKDRLRELRKNHLKMSRNDFGKRIDLGGGTCYKIEKGDINLTDRNISIICNTFNVNEEWLRYGTGEVFRKETLAKKEKKETEIDELKSKYGVGVNDFIIQAAINFMTLDKESKNKILEYFFKTVESYYKNNPDKFEELSNNIQEAKRKTEKIKQ